MIISKSIPVTYSNNKKYYVSKGYPDLKQGSVISVKLEDLPKNSNKEVECACDECGVTFSRSLQLINKQRSKQNSVDLCFECARIRVIAIMDTTNIVKSNRNRRGENHPRWRSDKSDFLKYSRLVRIYTERQPLYLLENHDKPRTLCGVKGGYQLDHKLSIREAFDRGIEPKFVGSLVNLQFIPWDDNRKKSSDSSIDLDINTFRKSNSQIERSGK